MSIVNNIIVDKRYEMINSDPSLSFFALSASAREVHTRALAVYFSALISTTSDTTVQLREDGMFVVPRSVYVFGKQMTGEYLLYVVGEREKVRDIMRDTLSFIGGKSASLDSMGKTFDRMSATIPRIASFPSVKYALYKFVWEKLLHIQPSDDVDVMYLNKIHILLKRPDTYLLYTSLDGYETNISDRPVLLLGDVPENYEFVDKLIEGAAYRARLYLHPLRQPSDVMYGFLAKVWYESQGYGAIYERIRDYLLLYVYGKGGNTQIPMLPSPQALENYRVLWKEIMADPIYRIVYVSMMGHVFDGAEVDRFTTWSDAIISNFTIRGRV